MLRKKLNEYEQQIKSLTRDNKVLAKKIDKIETASGKKNKKIDNEKDMRLRANRERYALKQKLDRLQKALEARLKMLGIDFSNINDLSEALEAAFAAIQKLAAELAKKEEELSAMSNKMEAAQREQEEAMKEVDKLTRKMAKSKNATQDLKKQIEDRDRRLSIVAKEKGSTESRETALQQSLEKLRNELEALRAAKSQEFDDFVDKKAEMDSKLKAKEKECNALKEDLEEMEAKNGRLEKENESLKDELESLRNAMDAQGQKLMEEEEKNKELQQEIEGLKDELESARGQNEQMKERNQSLQDELDKLKALLAEREEELAAANATIEEHESKMEAMQSDIDSKQRQIERLNAKNESLNEELSEMKQSMMAKDEELAAQKKAFADLEAAKKESEEEMQQMFDEQKMMNEVLKKKMAKLEEKGKEQEAAMKERDDELSSLRQSLAEERAAKEAFTKKAEETTKSNDEALEALSSEKTQFKEMADRLKAEGAAKDDEIERLKEALAAAEQQLSDHLNRPRDDKETQTEVSGKWIESAKMQINSLDSVYRENEELRRLATKNDDRLVELADENQVLLDEIDTLLKQQAQFRPDTSNHRGEVLAMCAAPNTYMAATSAKDKSVRLWTIDPEAPKTKDQVKPSFRAQMEGVAMSLAYTRDGTYLVAGCAYKNGPDGLLIVWNMLKGDGEVEFLFRSRPSVRFGRAQCVRWSNDNKYIFSGDTTGSVWIWDVVNQTLLAEVKAHSDVLHDIGIANDALFSCALDQTIAVFDMKRLDTKLTKKKRRAKRHSSSLSSSMMDKIHVHQPLRFKAKQLDRNDKYPYWVLAPTEDASLLVAGSRKINIWKFSGFGDEDDSKKQVSECSLEKGPRVTDTDLEHVQSLQVRRGQMVICRRDVPRAKIFSATNGSETAKAKFKSPPKRVQFTFDTEHCVVCCQKQDGKTVKAPSMHLWNYKK